MTENQQNGGDQLEELIRLAAGKITADERRVLEQKISADPKLRELYKVVRLLVRTSDKLISSDLASVARRLGKQIFREYRLQKEQPSRKQAITIFDSRGLPLPAGVRPAAVDTRKLKYRLPKGMVEIALYPVSVDSFEIVGMVSDQDSPPPYKIEVATGRRLRQFECDEVNLFRIPRISRGKHELRVYSHTELIGSISIEL